MKKPAFAGFISQPSGVAMPRVIEGLVVEYIIDTIDTYVNSAETYVNYSALH
jgi:hypothetical protein